MRELFKTIGKFIGLTILFCFLSLLIAFNTRAETVCVENSPQQGDLTCTTTTTTTTSQTTSNLLSPNFTDGSWTGTNVDLRHGNEVIAGFDGGYVESTVSLQQDANLTKEEINNGFSSTLGADIWFWNSNTQNVIMKQTLIDDNGVSITQQRQIDGSCTTFNGCDYSNYTDTIIVNGNSQQDYEITARFEFNESSNTTAHYAADLRNPSLTVSYYENFTQLDPIEFDDTWEDVIKEDYKMEYILEDYKLEEFVFLETKDDIIIFEETEADLDKEFEEKEILQAFGGPEIIPDTEPVEEDKPVDTEEVAIEESYMEEELEEKPQIASTDEEEKPKVTVSVQEIDSQIKAKVNSVEQQLQATNIIAAKLIEQQQVDIKSYYKSYTDNREIYQGNAYQDLREIYKDQKIYGNNTMVRVAMNDPVYKYQEGIRQATLKRVILEEELRRLQGR